MKGKDLLFNLIFIIIYYLANLYIGLRIQQGISYFFNINNYLFWISFLLISTTYIFGLYFDNIVHEKYLKIFKVLGHYWMIVLFFGLSVFPINDLIRSIFNINDSINTLLISILFILTIVMGSINARKAYIDEINISNNSTFLNENLNIVMVSDIHLGEVIGKKRLNKMVNEINALNPDLVIIAGDIVDTQIEPFIDKNMAEEFSNIKSKYGTYATLGNHDLILGKGEIIAEELRKNNVNVLRNEAVLINNDFYIIGRDDCIIDRLGNRRATLEEIISPLEKEKYMMVVDHTPNSIEESKRLGIDLHFSGHTHKGQLVPFNLITKRVYEVDHGYKKKDDLNIVVSAGYGTWGPPIRIGSKSEIMNIVIQ